MRISRLANFIIGSLLADDRGQRLDKVKTKVLMGARRKLAGRGLFITYSLAGRELVLPVEHDLPLLRKAYPQYSANAGRLAGYIGKKYPDFKMVDVGANIGDTAAIVREHSNCPILCIEGNDFYFALLQENLRRGQFKSVEAVRALVATYTGELKGQLVSGAGSAHFVEDEKAAVGVSRLSDLLEGFPAFRSPKFLKIDTDGFDCGILRSELEWLAAHTPAIFFEYDPFFFQGHPYDGSLIFDDLGRVGYQYAVLYDNFGDYLVSLDVQRDTEILKDLQAYYSGRQGHVYMDVLLLHRQDGDLAREIRRRELQWALGSRAAKR